MSTIGTIRTRFAPSPTGFLHVGGLRTALYCYLFAKKHNGQFILRIEDTDQNRITPGAIEAIINGLKWAGINYDEGPVIGGPYGPYIQSERLDLYKKHALELIEKGHAYYCFCSQERLEHVRNLQVAAKVPPAYDRHCRDIDVHEAQKKIQAGESYVIRMKVPLEGELTFVDLIRGQVSIGYKVVDDQVLLKSDGFPTYHLAAVVDDHYMKISHVIRGEEWLPSTPKHILLYKYFGWETPYFSHLSLLLNPDKSKLSKRTGSVSVEDYKNKGYLPDALVNFIALLGWNPGDTREIFSLEELVKEFSLEHVGKAGAIFNIEKLDWINEQYIHKKSQEELLVHVKFLLEQQGVKNFSDEYICQAISLMKERVTVLHDFVFKGGFFFKDPETFDPISREKNWNKEISEHIGKLAQEFNKLTVFNALTTESALRDYASKNNIGAGKLIHPLRLAVSGVGQGPSLFHILEVLGKEVTLKRISYAIKTL